MPEQTQFSADDFFAQQPPPKDLDKHLEDVHRFVQHNLREGRKIVLVTSGGTTVPLEHNVVRFLDNFSAGTRGASSAEHFLRTGQYAVIFLHRQHSLQPFSRHYSHSTNPFLDLLDVVWDTPPVADAEEDAHGEGEGKGKGPLFPPIPAMLSPGASPTTGTRPLPSVNSTISPATSTSVVDSSSGPSIHIHPRSLPPMLSLLRSYKLVKSLDILHSVPFVTVSEYLWYLRGISRVMSQTKDDRGEATGRRGMYYLAAAVSDFYIPYQKVSEHKIQSGKGSLVIEMDQVPKVLKTMVDEWSNEGFVVSFKLETDPEILLPKARAALQRYGHQIVIGNLLDTRKYEVAFVTPPPSSSAVAGGEEGIEWIRIPKDGKKSDGEVHEIEEDIVRRLVELHEGWIAGAGAGAGVKAA
ncbi:hypothetical protein JCM10213_005717 [Rhodosporidiobolus nylandii]